MEKYIELDLHFTNRCNMTCKHCLYSSGTDIGQVPIERLNKTISEFSTIGLETIHIGGGEPLTRYEDLLLLVENASSFGVRTRLITNATLLTEQKLDKLISKGLNEVLISIDGMEEYHNSFRNYPGSFKKCVAALEMCVKKGIFTRVNSVLTHENSDEILRLLELTTGIPIDTHAVLCLSPMGRGHEISSLVPDFNDVEKFIQCVKDKFSHTGITTKLQIQKGFLEPEKGDPFDYCRIEKRINALIYSTGNVFPCVRFSNYGTSMHEQFSLGNINNESIIKIWSADNPKWLNFKRTLVRCTDCRQSKCKGGCRGLMQVTNENMNLCDYRCNYSESHKLPSCIRRYEVISTY